MREFDTTKLKAELERPIHVGLQPAVSITTDGNYGTCLTIAMEIPMRGDYFRFGHELSKKELVGVSEEHIAKVFRSLALAWMVRKIQQLQAEDDA